MTKVINFYGGPSAGKSTMSGKLFGWMKEQRMNVEFVPEFAKTLTWRKAQDCLDDQLYVFGQQHHDLYVLQGQVDYVIMDSPLLMQLHYFKMGLSKFQKKEDVDYDRMFNEFVISTYLQYDNVNFYVERGNRKFIQAGRNQDELTSKQYDNDIHKILVENWVEFKRVTCLEDVLHTLQLEENYV